MNIKANDFILKDLNQGYLVGGAVRDFLLGKNIYDRDIAVKNAEKFSIELSKKLDATFITLDTENKIYRLVLKDKVNYLDITEIQGNTIEEDLARRDFTINAIAFDLSSEEFIDPFGGIGDLNNKLIREIKEENFIDDPLRILRAYRFKSTTSFIFTKELEQILKNNVSLIKSPAKERINYEIMKLFGGDNASGSLLEMDKIGLLEIIFPIVNELKKVPANTHHHLPLFYHSIETVQQVENLYLNSKKEILEHLNRIDFGGFPRINHLKLAAFLHDIGKFSTWTIENSGRHRFIGHDNQGAKIVVPILKELKFSKKQIDYVSKMIKYHIYPSGIIASSEFNEKAMMRYIRKMEDSVIDNIILAKADRLSARGPAISEEIIKTNLTGLDKLLNFYLEQKDTIKPLPKLLDGNEIMSILKIQPSPMLGEIVNALYEAQLNGDILTKKQATEFIKVFYDKNK